MVPFENPIPLPVEELVPPPERFAHESRLHGPAHVARVVIHGFVLVRLTRREEESARLWGAAYVHDLMRLHDGRCRDHGARAAALLEQDTLLREHLSRGGVRDDDLEAIRTAITWHCLPEELDEGHPHRPLTALLKDADGLDRVRLHDLDPRFLRHPESRRLIPFANRLLGASRDLRGPTELPALWSRIPDLLGDLS
jgi:hypothetical protein